jgi:hypothetical protein
MQRIRIVLETSDFSVEHSTNARDWVNVTIYGPDGSSVELEMHPEVTTDLARALLLPEDP